MKEKIELIKNLIASAKLKTAIEKLLEYDLSNQRRNKVTILKSQFTRLEEQQSQFTISDSEFAMQINKINALILQLCDEILNDSPSKEGNFIDNMQNITELDLPYPKVEQDNQSVNDRFLQIGRIYDKTNFGDNQAFGPTEKVLTNFLLPDRNNIIIPDTPVESPLIIPFGPREMGKTCSIIRLSMYLNKYSEYSIKPNKLFRSDPDYEFITKVYEEYYLKQTQEISSVPSRTADRDFLILDVFKKNKLHCQILEAPGEHYFDRNANNHIYPSYLQKIFNGDYKKIYLFFIEIGMFSDEELYYKYLTNLEDFLRNKFVPKRDKIIIVSCRCDEHPYFKKGRPDVREFKAKTIEMNNFKNIIKELTSIGISKIDFIPFSSGEFQEMESKRCYYSPSSDHYPAQLWKLIEKNLTKKKFWIV